MTDNELIAEFMGVRVFEKRPRHNIGIPEGDGRYYLIDKMKYHISWDWLMPVVEKIESLGHKVRITLDSCDVADVAEADWIGASEPTKIQATYATVVDFIKWYNQTKKP